MKLFGRKKGINYIPGNDSNSVYMSERGIRNIVDRFEKSGKDKCLSIGSGDGIDNIYTTLDYRKLCEADLYGDIRCCFAPGMVDKIDKYPDLKLLKSGSYTLVRLSHVIEHIEWIHQEILFEWINSLVAEGGLVFVSTPNFDYQVKMYLKAMQEISKTRNRNKEKLKDGVLPNFPFDDHPYIKEGRPIDVIRWANSIIHAGCSYDWDHGEFRADYHHCSYNKLWLVDMLSRHFKDVHIYDGKILEAVAQKPFTENQGVENLIKRSFT